MRDYAAYISGDIIEIPFSYLRQQAEQGYPGSLQIKDWMCVGPFVLETDGMFETEYFYAREKLLRPDYLASSGGERDYVPYLGRKVGNDYLGPATLEWIKSVVKWNGIRFDGQSADCDEALFLTEKRNAVYYAAVYIRCTQQEFAIINYENSGSRLFLNGQLLDEKPYGRLRGISDYGYAVTACFSAGLNLLMFKIRPGYICDAVDISISHCSIYPLMAKTANLGLAYPSVIDVFRDSNEPKRIYPCYVAALQDNASGRIDLQGETYAVPALSAGECYLLRLAAKAENDPYECEFKLQDGLGFSIPGHFRTRAGLMPDASCRRLIYSVFHFDTTYHQEQKVYAMGALHNLKGVISRLRANPVYKATVSELDYLHPYYVIYPEDRADLRRFYREGRAEADCFYNQPNEMTSSGEALVRNLLYGQIYHRDVLGRKTYVYNPFDVFGHCSQISQICVKGGCTGIAWGKIMLGLDPVFNHVSPDGTKMIHTHNVIDASLATKLSLPVCHSGENILAANMPPYPQLDDTSWMKNTQPPADFAVQSDWQSSIGKENARNNNYPVTSRDISLYHAGTALTRTDFKQANRLCENLLVSAEKLSVIAALHGADYPEKTLDKAWRQVLCGQHHDSITGTNNETSFIDLLIQYREAAELAATINMRATEFITSSINFSRRTKPLVVFNTHTWPRSEFTVVQVCVHDNAECLYLTDAEGHVVDSVVLDYIESREGKIYNLGFIADVPALGYKTFYLGENEKHRSKPQVPIQDESETRNRLARYWSIENDYLRIRVDSESGGGIISLYDKEQKRELIDISRNGPGNRVIALKEKRDRRETQHEFFTTGHRLGSEMMRAEVKADKHELYSRLSINCPLGNLAVLHQEITLHRGSRRIDFNLHIDGYNSEDDLFCVTFPTALRGVVPVFDDRFAPQVRNKSLGSLDFRTHQMMMFSHCAVFAANQWLDYGPGITVNLQDKDSRGSINLGMTQIIRAEDEKLAQIAVGLLEDLTRKAIPVTIYPDTIQEALKSRIIHFNEDLSNDTRLVLSLVGRENKYEQKLLASLSESTLIQFNERLEKEELGFLYLVDSDNDWQKPIDVLLLKAKSVGALESGVKLICDQLGAGRFVNLPVVTQEELTPADDYGIALINNGNIACSVEKGGMLNLMLFHTAEFYGNIGKTNCGGKLVPEQKSHFFTYALYPHAGSYREADIYRRASEFNDPLWGLAVTKRKDNPYLPETAEYLRAEGRVLITSVKAGGAPVAALKADYGQLSERGISIRLFETDGLPAKLILHTGFALESASQVDLLEEDQRAVSFAASKIKFQVEPHAIETLSVQPALADVLKKTAIAPEKEKINPVYVRSWEYNLGSTPMGFLAAAGIIGRRVQIIDDSNFSTVIYMTNSYTDRKIAGIMYLRLPDGWQADQEEFSYDLQAGEYQQYPVTITKPDKDAVGAIRLEYDHDGQMFEDIYESGNQKIEFSLQPCTGGYKATIANQSGSYLRGSIYLASPIETWGCMYGLNRLSQVEITSWQQMFELESGEKKEYKFELDCQADDKYSSRYAVAKLCFNGKTCYAGTIEDARCELSGAEAMLQQINEAKGSISVLNLIK